MSTISSKNKSLSNRDVHLQYLDMLETIADTCCEICQCDCYSSHSALNTENIFEAGPSSVRLEPPVNKLHSKKSSQRKKTKSNGNKLKRSKSASSFYTKDCKILKELNLNDKLPRVRDSTRYPRWSSMESIELCEPMRNLCLSPTVSKAFEKVPLCDKKILNRMAKKRGEKIVDNENAWLAQKFWENEQYERELLKCEQTEEFKKAIRNKQFQDYQITKARLNEIAQRDMDELQRLRASLREKDKKAK